MKDKQLKRVLIMAGGTGGHVFPGLALAQALRAEGVEVHWLGTSQGLEARLVPEANLPLHIVTIGGLRGKNLKTLLTAPLKLTRAVLQARRIIRQVNPQVVVGMGGFASGPGGIASWLLGYPLIIHEQNAKAGMTNKMLARIAKKILQGFPNAFQGNDRVLTIGNPVRENIENIIPPASRFASSRKPLRLLILGGSLGAQALNELVPKALSRLDAAERPEVWHQAGDKHIEKTKAQYADLNVQANLSAFVTDMAEAYAWADVVICRAGALTVAELCAAGVCAIFVPFPFAVDDHQTANARFMVSHQAAFCIQQKDLTDERLAAIVKQLSDSPEQRLSMANAAYQLRKTQVAEKIVDICKEICR
jgi:UDP-N-acetylglucosamine--N-acetylmuramyl-(pentapeptide) pyrophosphoryl-undecaprenol N-acetylglucosamine transferase